MSSDLLARVIPLHDGIEMKVYAREIRALFTELSAATEALAAKETELSAWHEAFGTTQLTHATAAMTTLNAENSTLHRERDNLKSVVEKRDKCRHVLVACQSLVIRPLAEMNEPTPDTVPRAVGENRLLNSDKLNLLRVAGRHLNERIAGALKPAHEAAAGKKGGEDE